MRLPFLAGVLMISFLALEVSKAVPLKKKEDQDKTTKSIVEVNKECQIPGFQPVQGSICLRLLLLAGINFNIGVGTGQDSKDKNKILNTEQSQQRKEQKRDKKKKRGQKKKKDEEEKEEEEEEEEEKGDDEE